MKAPLLRAARPSRSRTAAWQRIIYIAADGADVYWTDYYQGTITRVPAGGGTPQTLLTGQDEAYGIAVDAKHVYWTTYGDGVSGAVFQMDK